MDEEEKRNQEKINYMNDHYLTGKRNKAGAAYNVISLEYEQSQDGEVLR